MIHCEPIALNAEQGAPDWINLLPPGPVVPTADGRGPYRIVDAAKLASDSLLGTSCLPIDENHATDLAAPLGGPSPARGWIVELKARGDGVWGRVKWTTRGASLLAEHAYKYISPAIAVRADGTITRILRAALTNTPNLPDLIALNSSAMSELSDSERRIVAMMGLDASAFLKTKRNSPP